MKLKEMPVSPEALQAATKMIAARIDNLRFVVQRGHAAPSECTMAEICMVEGKLDALMSFLEDQGMDFSKFNEYLATAYNQGFANAINIRTQMQNQKPGKA